MNRYTLIFFLLIGTIFMACQSEKHVEIAEVQQLLDEQQVKFLQLNDLITSLDANLVGMQLPLQDLSREMEGDPNQDIQAQMGFDEAQMIEFKNKFTSYSESLEVLRPGILNSLEALKPIERDLRMMLTAMEEVAEKPDPAWTITYNDNKAKLELETPKIDEAKSKIVAIQNEIIEWLNSNQFMKSGVTHIILESPIYIE
jgi:hypothetical protein